MQHFAAQFPVLYTVLGLRRVAVPAAAGGGAAGVVGPVPFRFPAEREVTGLLVLPEAGTPEALAALSLEIVDEEDEEVFSDQIGDTGVPRLPFAVPCLSMAGRGFHAFPIQRFVKSGSLWSLTLKNSSVGIVRVASVSIHHREIVR